MYQVIKNFLINLGYNVKAEVLNADIVAIKDEQILIVEMKTSFSTHLIHQGLMRQHHSDYVYLAIPKPSNKVLKSSVFNEKKNIVRRLELGLMLIDIKQDKVEVLLDPNQYHYKKNHRKRKKLINEFNLRQTSMNTGGVHREKIITAYKELALLALNALKDGPKSTSDLRNIMNHKKIVSILQKNYYGWFERVSRGVYQITPLGDKAILEYQEVINQMSQNNPK